MIANPINSPCKAAMILWHKHSSWSLGWVVMKASSWNIKSIPHSSYGPLMFGLWSIRFDGEKFTRCSGTPNWGAGGCRWIRGSKLSDTTIRWRIFFSWKPRFAKLIQKYMIHQHWIQMCQFGLIMIFSVEPGAKYYRSRLLGLLTKWKVHTRMEYHTSRTVSTLLLFAEHQWL